MANSFVKTLDGKEASYITVVVLCFASDFLWFCVAGIVNIKTHNHIVYVTVYVKENSKC